MGFASAFGCQFATIDLKTSMIGKYIALLGAENARFVIQHADGAERQIIRRRRQGASVKAYLRIAGYQRIAVETGIPRCVFHFQIIVFKDAAGADRLLQRRLAQWRADRGLEPLPAFIDQADDRDQVLTDVAADSGDIVEGRFDRSVRIARGAQGSPPFGFVGVEGAGSGSLDSSKILLTADASEDVSPLPNGEI
ncbi:MAG: hypothetical protein H7312_17505 [Tardiphaga sp.]|nr:hypothetical protein [Tardiphaga sp.]